MSAEIPQTHDIILQLNVTSHQLLNRKSQQKHYMAKHTNTNQI